jgi:hypothetical protein
VVHHQLPFTKHQLVTPLAPSTCQRRLRKSVAPSLRWSPGRAKAVRGQVSGRGFTLAKRIDHQNWFQTQASGELTAIPDGTRITVRLRPSLLALIWYGVCFGWFLFAGSVCIIGSIALPSSLPGGPLRYAAMALVVLLFLSFAVWSGCWLARDEGPFLLRSCARHLRHTTPPVARTCTVQERVKPHPHRQDLASPPGLH